MGDLAENRKMLKKFQDEYFSIVVQDAIREERQNVIRRLVKMNVPEKTIREVFPEITEAEYQSITKDI
ncbi:hypothetical protein [Domibacillus tundrae]|uniref:hypothetical protein n=1 Tax=Domibacillus tundrae TaxID=1587527 RepID=UPI000617B6AD|nr:hypothetical protein [Domibacillus tundrae]